MPSGCAGITGTAIVSEEAFAQVQAKLDANQQTAARNTATSTCCAR